MFNMNIQALRIMSKIYIYIVLDELTITISNALVSDSIRMSYIRITSFK